MEHEPTASDPHEEVKIARAAIDAALREHDEKTADVWRERERTAREAEITAFPADFKTREEAEEWFERLYHVYNELMIWRRDEGLLDIDDAVKQELAVKLARCYSLLGETGHAADIMAEHELSDEDVYGRKAA